MGATPVRRNAFICQQFLVENLVTVVMAFLSGLVYGRVRQASASLLPAAVMPWVSDASERTVVATDSAP
jgi:hypothetical protein